LVRKTGVIAACRLYASAQNVYTLTSYSGLDPEIGMNDPQNIGVDNIRYPVPRSIVFGFNLQF
jgi:hypothetical protein